MKYNRLLIAVCALVVGSVKGVFIQVFRPSTPQLSRAANLASCP
jgi:hypothetical protein